ncbi:MAG: DUF2721 domain-containing protein, partial [Tagaea sp.]
MIPGTEGEVEGIAHLIQMAIAPVFLLNGLGILLNVFTGRLARVVDRTRNLAREMRGQCEPERHAQLKSELGTQRLRLFVVNGAIGLVSISAFLTCCAILALFVGGVAKLAAGAAPGGVCAAAGVAGLLGRGVFVRV